MIPKPKKRGRTSRIRRRRSLAPSRPIPDTSPEMIDFLRFLKSRGFHNRQPHSIQPTLYPDCGRGLRCPSATLKAGQSILQLPLSCVIQPSTIRSLEPKLYGGLGDEETLIFWIYNERLKLEQGHPGEWASYIRLLPQNYAHLPLFNLTIDRRRLPRTFNHQLDDQFNDYFEYQEVIKEHIAAKRLRLQLNVPLFQWAYCVVNTRCLDPRLSDDKDSIEDSVILVPFFDLLNHDPHASVDICLRKSTGVFEVVTERSIVKGTQIFICYHPSITNRDLFIDYGFIHQTTVPQPLRSPATSLRICPSPCDTLTVDFLDLQRLLESDDMPSKLDKRWTNRLKKLIRGGIYSVDGTEAAKFSICWPKRFTEKQCVVGLNSDGGFAVFTLSGEPITDATLSHLLDSINIELDILATLLALKEMPQKVGKLALSIRDEWMTQSPLRVGPKVPLYHEEALLYYRFQLKFVSKLLKDEFALDAPLPGVNLVALAGKYLNNEAMAHHVAPLRAVFRNEVALLLFTAVQLNRKIQLLQENPMEMLLDVEA